MNTAGVEDGSAAPCPAAQTQMGPGLAAQTGMTLVERPYPSASAFSGPSVSRRTIHSVCALAPSES